MSEKKQERKLIAFDCETDPFLHGRVPEPFIWGAWDGEEFFSTRDTLEFMEWLMGQHAIAYAHNGGKFDFMFFLPFLGDNIQPRIINGRIVEMQLGDCILRDSYAIIPGPLSAFKKDEIDYALFEQSTREKHMAEITEYLKSDCVYLYELVSTFRRMAGKRITIASTALGFAQSKLKIDPGKSNKKYDDKLREFYYGGRVETFRAGILKHAWMYDIKSAYPRAMEFEHPTGTRYHVDDNPRGADFITLRCISKGAFPRREKDGLSFPHDAGIFHVTGWEYRAAKRHRLISDVEILACLHFEEKITFREYVQYWFDAKDKAEREGDAAGRLVAKLMMNSLYGKLAQNPFKYSDYLIVQRGTEVAEGWYLAEFTDDYEIHARPAEIRLREKYPNLEDAPIFLNVATAASITGFVRAMLLDAISEVGAERVAYCDTDSLIVIGPEPVNLKLGEELGSWAFEGYASEVAIAGKKLYATSRISEGPLKGRIKTASKGALLTAQQIRRIAKGDEITWANDAPTFALGKTPKFVLRKIRATTRAALIDQTKG